MHWHQTASPVLATFLLAARVMGRTVRPPVRVVRRAAMIPLCLTRWPQVPDDVFRQRLKQYKDFFLRCSLDVYSVEWEEVLDESLGCALSWCRDIWLSDAAEKQLSARKAYAEAQARSVFLPQQETANRGCPWQGMARPHQQQAFYRLNMPPEWLVMHVSAGQPSMALVQGYGAAIQDAHSTPRSPAALFDLVPHAPCSTCPPPPAGDAAPVRRPPRGAGPAPGPGARIGRKRPHQLHGVRAVRGERGSICMPQRATGGLASTAERWLPSAGRLLMFFRGGTWCPPVQMELTPVPGWLHTECPTCFTIYRVVLADQHLGVMAVGVSGWVGSCGLHPGLLLRCWLSPERPWGIGWSHMSHYHILRWSVPCRCTT